jgi:hypothetical protein
MRANRHHWATDHGTALNAFLDFLLDTISVHLPFENDRFAKSFPFLVMFKTMFPVSSPAFDLSAALAAAQSHLAATSVGTGARTEDVLASSSFSGPSPTLAPTTYADGAGISHPSVGFSTPSVSGRDSGVLGEYFAAGGVPGDLGVFSVFVMTSQMASDLCCGEVAGLKFCTAGRQACSIRKHSKKVKVRIGHIYVSGPRNSAFTQISLDPTSVSSSLVSRILGEKLSLDAWQCLFGAIGQASTELSEGEFESLKDRVLTGVTLGLTPRKGIQCYEDDRVSVEYQSTKLSPIGQYKDENLDMESLLSAQLDKVSTFSKGTAQSLDLLHQAVSEDIDQLEVGLWNLTLKVGADISLDPTSVSSSLVSRILGEKLSLDAWQRLFGAIGQAPTELSEGEFESLKDRVLTGVTLGLTKTVPYWAV